MSLDGVTTEELRTLVRSVLRDILPPQAPGTSYLPAAETASSYDVRLAGDADLDAFVRRIATLCEDPERRAALREGRHAFRLATTVPPVAPVETPAAVRPHRVDRGAVTERLVNRAAADKAALSLGRAAVLTPLARDRARVLGVRIERDR